MVSYSFKKRFIAPIRAGLGLPLSVEDFAARMDEFGNVSQPRPKRQTIRAIGKRRHARPGETLQIYTAMRTKQCEKIGEARCLSVVPIRIIVKEHSMPTWIGGAFVGAGSAEYPGGLYELAQRDGFEGSGDMHEFWKTEHGIGEFEGALIKWEPV